MSTPSPPLKTAIFRGGGVNPFFSRYSVFFLVSLHVSQIFLICWKNKIQLWICVKKFFLVKNLQICCFCFFHQKKIFYPTSKLFIETSFYVLNKPKKLEIHGDVIFSKKNFGVHCVHCVQKNWFLPKITNLHFLRAVRAFFVKFLKFGLLMI